jgi:hypothetical protein
MLLQVPFVLPLNPVTSKRWILNLPFSNCTSASRAQKEEVVFASSSHALQPKDQRLVLLPFS